MSAAQGAPELIPFMPTPFAGDGIDEDAVRRQMEVYAPHGTSVGLMGGMGEFFSLSVEEVERLLFSASEAMAGRAPIYAAIGFPTREAVRLAKIAADAQCTGLVVNPPYYVAPAPRAWAEHVRALTEASGLDAVVYSSHHLVIDDEYLDELVKVEGFAGVKEETTSPDEFAALVQRWGERVKFWAVGEHRAEEYLAAGAQVLTSGMANICPQASYDHIAGVDRSGELAALITESVQMLGAERCTAASASKWMIAEIHEWPTSVRGPVSDASPKLRERVKRFVAAVRERYEL